MTAEACPENGPSPATQANSPFPRRDPRARNRLTRAHRATARPRKAPLIATDHCRNRDQTAPASARPGARLIVAPKFRPRRARTRPGALRPAGRRRPFGPNHQGAQTAARGLRHGRVSGAAANRNCAQHLLAGRGAQPFTLAVKYLGGARRGSAPRHRPRAETRAPRIARPETKRGAPRVPPLRAARGRGLPRRPRRRSEPG